MKTESQTGSWSWWPLPFLSTKILITSMENRQEEHVNFTFIKEPEVLWECFLIMELIHWSLSWLHCKSWKSSEWEILTLSFLLCFFLSWLYSFQLFGISIALESSNLEESIPLMKDFQHMLLGHYYFCSFLAKDSMNFTFSLH